MDEDKKYQKVDLHAIMDVIQASYFLLKNADVCQRANGVYIFTRVFEISVATLVTISLQLYGRHDAMEVNRYVGDGDYTLEIHGSVYFLLQKFYVKGETVNSKERILKAITE